MYVYNGRSKSRQKPTRKCTLVMAVTGGRHYRVLFPPSFVSGRTEMEGETRVDWRSWCRGGWGEWDGKLIKLSLIYPSPRQAYTTYLLFHLSSPCILSDCFPYLSLSLSFTRGIRNSWKEALNISIWHRMDENLHCRCFYPVWRMVFEEKNKNVCAKNIFSTVSVQLIWKWQFVFILIIKMLWHVQHFDITDEIKNLIIKSLFNDVFQQYVCLPKIINRLIFSRVHSSIEKH